MNVHSMVSLVEKDRRKSFGHISSIVFLSRREFGNLSKSTKLFPKSSSELGLDLRFVAGK